MADFEVTPEFEPFLRTALIVQAEAFAAVNGLSLGYVSRCAFLDARFIEKLKSGEGSFTVRKFDEAMQFFEKRWPPWRHRPPLPKLVVQDGNLMPLARRNPGERNGKKIRKGKGPASRRRKG